MKPTDLTTTGFNTGWSFVETGVRSTATSPIGGGVAPQWIVLHDGSLKAKIKEAVAEMFAELTGKDVVGPGDQE